MAHFEYTNLGKQENYYLQQKWQPTETQTSTSSMCVCRACTLGQEGNDSDSISFTGRRKTTKPVDLTFSAAQLGSCTWQTCSAIAHKGSPILKVISHLLLVSWYYRHQGDFWSDACFYLHILNDLCASYELSFLLTVLSSKQYWLGGHIYFFKSVCK